MSYVEHARERERMVVDDQASYLLSQMLGAVRLKHGDRISITVHVTNPRDGIVATDRRTLGVPEPLCK